MSVTRPGMLRSSSSIESDLPPTQRVAVAVEALSYYEDEANKPRLATLKQYTSTDRKNFRNGRKKKLANTLESLVGAGTRYVYD